MTESKATTLITPEVRLAFPSLFVRRPKIKGSDDLTYQSVLLLPPDVDLAPFHAAMAAAMTARWGKVQKLPATANPIHEAEEKAGTAGFLPGWRYINTHANRPVGVVDRMAVPITPDEDEDPEHPGRFRKSSRVYAGVWAKVFLNCYAWEFSGKRGVSFGLVAVQIVRDDERIDGGVDATQVFTPLGELPGGPAAAGAGGDDMEKLFG